MAGPSGFFLGGMAEGEAASAALRVKENEAETKRMAVIDSRIGDTVKTAANIVKEARMSGAAPDKIKALIAPLMQDVDRISQVVGRDSGPIHRQMEAMIMTPQPAAESAKPEKPLSDVGKIIEDVRAGRVPKEVGEALIKRKTDEGQEAVKEGILRKVQTGGLQSLTPGEKVIFDNVIAGFPLAKLLQGAAGIGGAGAVVPPPQPSNTPAVKPDPLKVR